MMRKSSVVVADLSFACPSIMSPLAMALGISGCRLWESSPLRFHGQHNYSWLSPVRGTALFNRSLAFICPKVFAFPPLQFFSPASVRFSGKDRVLGDHKRLAPGRGTRPSPLPSTPLRGLLLPPFLSLRSFFPFCMYFEFA